MWDIGEDTFDSFDGVGILEVANLSLDEPDLEAILFTEDVAEEPKSSVGLGEGGDA